MRTRWARWLMAATVVPLGAGVAGIASVAAAAGDPVRVVVETELTARASRRS